MMQPMARLVRKRKADQLEVKDIAELLYSCLPPLFADRDFAFTTQDEKETKDAPATTPIVSRQQQLITILSTLLKKAYDEFQLPHKDSSTSEHSWRSRLQGVAAGVADHPMVECEPAIHGPIIASLIYQVQPTHDTNYRNGEVACSGSWHWQKPEIQPTPTNNAHHLYGTAHGTWVTAAIAALGYDASRRLIAKQIAKRASRNPKRESVNVELAPFEELSLESVTVTEEPTIHTQYDHFNLKNHRLGLGYRLGNSLTIAGQFINIQLTAQLGRREHSTIEQKEEASTTELREHWLNLLHAIEQTLHRLVPAWCQTKVTVQAMQGNRNLISLLGPQGLPLGQGLTLTNSKGTT